jgi:hypothetical protein
MNAPNDNTAPKGLRGWWLTPPRTGFRRFIFPYEYRHLRFFGVGRIAGGIVAATAGVICLSYGVYAWAAFFLVIAARTSRVAPGTSITLAPDLPKPEPGQTPRRRWSSARSRGARRGRTLVRSSATRRKKCRGQVRYRDRR